MNKFVIAAIAAAAILPSAAMAKPFDHRPTKVVVVEHKAPVHRLTVGTRVEPGFIARHDAIKQPARYHLAHAGKQTRWLKVRNDAVLVNLRTGRVMDIVYRLF